jgi:nucleoside-diphosphate-sugar epimerase
MNKPKLLIPVPVWIFLILGKLSGKEAVIDRLVGNLQVDGSAAKEYLGWEPTFTVEQGIKSTVDNFLNIDNSDSNK